MRISRPACSSVSSSSPSRRSSGTRTGSIGASSLPAGARSTAQHLISAGSRSGPVDRRPARPGLDDLQDQRIPQGRPGVVAVPAGQLDQLIQDPGLRLPRRVPIREGLLLRHSLPLGHRELHENGHSRQPPPTPSTTPLRGGFQMRQRIGYAEVFYESTRALDTADAALHSGRRCSIDIPQAKQACGQSGRKP